jgi:uncharacterized protein YndB with AHSA1/START domain
MKPATAIQATDEVVVPFSPTQVWRVLADVAAYPDWWPQPLHLRVLHCDSGLVGSEVELRPFGGRPLRCRVDAIQEPRCIRMQYSGGFVDGRGEWSLEPSASGTRVRYELDVRAHGWLVAGLSRLLPLARIHSRQMKGVLKQLGRVLAQSTGGAPPGTGEGERARGVRGGSRHESDHG